MTKKVTLKDRDVGAKNARGIKGGPIVIVDMPTDQHTSLSPLGTKNIVLMDGSVKGASIMYHA